MTETKRLYYEDVYKKEFTAKVLECREAKIGFHIILDESAFYPEGGGQPSDAGYLNDVKVKEVHEKDGELLHYTDKPLEAGTEVQGRIDWARRFDLMQQHSGEHMVSGLIHEAYGYDNGGFHMGSDTITVDLNGPLDETQLAEIEQKTNEKIWEAIYNVPDEEVWKTRVALKNKLIDYIRNQFRDTWLKNQRDPSRVVSLMDKINPNALLIGFARRFATYKRAHLLFTDLDRLAKIVNNPDYPVQFLFAGKAHPHDGAGQGLIKKIVEISNRPEFLGKIIFLENYDMKLARRLVSGVDIWMNTPTRPLEASGTSGEKALMNGVVNLSVLDGWWLEGYREGAGWALTEKRTYQNQEHQDQLDAATIYSLLETEILPLYYARNKKGYSEGWVKTIKNSIAQVAPHYTMKRQLDDYFTKFYGKEAARFHELAANDYAKAKEIAKWKEEVAEKWDSIEVVSMDKCEDLRKGNIETGKEYVITCVVDEKGLDDAVGIELVTTYTTAEGKEYVYSVEPMEMVHRDGNLFTFKVTHSLSNSGSFKVAYRMFPKHEALPHRQDFCYVRWFNKD